MQKSPSHFRILPVCQGQALVQHSNYCAMPRPTSPSNPNPFIHPFLPPAPPHHHTSPLPPFHPIPPTNANHQNHRQTPLRHSRHHRRRAIPTNPRHTPRPLHRDNRPLARQSPKTLQPTQQPAHSHQPCCAASPPFAPLDDRQRDANSKVLLGRVGG